MKFFFAISTILCACQSQQTPIIQTVVTQPQSVITISKDSIPCPESMLENPTDTIPPNLYSPKIRYSFCGWWMPEDTTTPNGNFIHYLISNDTCCLDYLYLAWGNKQFSGLKNLGTLRRFHPKMNPIYVGESNDYLFLESSASSGMPIVGWNLWVFPLVAGRPSEVFSTVSPDAYDLKSMTIIREAEENRTDHYAFEAYNIRTKRIKQIHLKNRLNSSCPSWDIDSISITPRSIFIRVETMDKNDEIVLENITIPNDIK